MKRDPCPFCGSGDTERKESNQTRHGELYHWIECAGCGTRGPRSQRQYEIDKLWNSRRDADPIHRVVPVKA